ncbi:MAG: triose-phosphate isomerase [Candidatus Eiseniibacteriota bacterium]
MSDWLRRPRVVIGNWKMNKTPAECAALAAAIRREIGEAPRARVALCPPYPALTAVRAAIEGAPLLLGAQNLHAESAGAFTGEVSGGMLTACGCVLVLVGHSERRHGMGEDDAMVARKLRAAQRDRLLPVVCVGETFEERERNITRDVLVRQVSAVYGGLSKEAARWSVIAYEPVWAIGTGRVATVDQAAEAHRVIREALSETAGAGLGSQIPVLYGGSVTPQNVGALFSSEEVDGALVGGASLEAAQFAKIVAAA